MNKFLKKANFQYVQGKASWVRVVKPDVAFNCWAVTIHPTPDSLEKIRDWQAEGLKNQLKKDDDGYYCKFRCDVSKQRKDGSVWTFKQPETVDKDGKPMDGSIIGNGSDVTLKLEVYEHGTPGGGRAIAARLVGVRVDNLVPFNPETDFTDAEQARVEGLKEQPEQLF